MVNQVEQMETTVVSMVVTIDGPAGAGKSSVARALARRLGFRFLDTGATYRAVAWAAMERGISWSDGPALVALARELEIQLGEDHVLVDGRDVTREIRASRVTSVIHYVADHPEVRARLVEFQRQAAENRSVVTEGRDQGTVVFPGAECKIFLTASPEERARRRLKDLEKRGEAMGLQDVIASQSERDWRDATRPVGALLKAEDAIEVTTDGLSPEEVVERLAHLVELKRAAK